MTKAVQGVLDHSWARPGHPRDIDQGLELRDLEEVERPLGDVDGQVAHALELAPDLHPRRDEPQVAGHRLPEGEEPHALLVDVDVEEVDALFLVQDLAGQLLLAVFEPPNNQGDLLLSPGGHLEQLLLEGL